MKVIVRGLPNFAHVQVHDVSDIDSFLAHHDLRVTRMLEVRAEYINPIPKARVSFYVEGVEANRSVIERLCFNQKASGLRGACCITLNERGGLKSFGTTGCFNPDRSEWYMVEPKTDPRYADKLRELQEWEKERRRLILIEQEKEDQLREQIEDRINNLGYAEALRRLTGDQA